MGHTRLGGQPALVGLEARVWIDVNVGVSMSNVPSNGPQYVVILITGIPSARDP